MPEDDQDKRLRDLEKLTAVMGETMKTIQTTLTDIKGQIQGFLDKASLALAIEARVEHLEGETTELFRKADAAFKSIDSHKQEFATLKAEHAVCRQAQPASWWKERLGRFLDAGLIGVVVWLLMLFKAH